MRIQIGLETHDGVVGDPGDEAVIEINAALRDRIQRFQRVLHALGAQTLTEFNRDPVLHFKAPGIRVERVRLVVDRSGDFWWEGRFAGRSGHWQTGRIPAALRESAEDSIHDLRPPAEAGEPEEDRIFINHYRHCGEEWEDRWSCACNDRCPVCNAEIEPYASEEIGAEAGQPG